MTDKLPVTPAVRVLRQAKVVFEPFLYKYEEKGGTAASARALGVDEHVVIKTLVFENERKQPLVVLMHGDREVSTKNLARLIDCKQISPCQPDVAEKHSGYQVGGTSPFGIKKQMPIYAESSIQVLEKIYINGGKRGFLVGMAPGELKRVLDCQWVQAGLE